MAGVIKKVSYDIENDTLEIDGIRYSGLLLYGLANLPEGSVVKIVKRVNGVLTLKTVITEVDYNG